LFVQVGYVMSNDGTVGWILCW